MPDWLFGPVWLFVLPIKTLFTHKAYRAVRKPQDSAGLALSYSVAQLAVSPAARQAPLAGCARTPTAAMVSRLAVRVLPSASPFGLVGDCYDLLARSASSLQSQTHRRRLLCIDCLLSINVSGGVLKACNPLSGRNCLSRRPVPLSGLICASRAPSFLLELLKQRADKLSACRMPSYVSSLRAPLHRHCCSSVTEAAYRAASQVLLFVAAVAVAAISVAAQQAADEVCSPLAQTCMFAL